ncbi:MAG: hypothetical protein WCB27_25905 [Thermoguttaceae bacterium]|jgi:hypothetical protein
MSQERLNDELAAIEAALSSLTPVASGIDRDRLMFLAGRNAASRGSPRRRLAAKIWPMATAASLFVAATFAILWGTSKKPQLVERSDNVLMADVPAAVDVRVDASPPSPWENRRLYRLVLEKGIDALPESPGHFVPGAPAVPHEETHRNLLKQFLDNPNG